MNLCAKAISYQYAFYASPKVPRLLSPDAIRDTITRGVAKGLTAYASKTGSGDYKPFYFNQALMTADIEFSEEMFLVTKETAEAYLKAKASVAQASCLPVEQASSLPSTESSGRVSTPEPAKEPSLGTAGRMPAPQPKQLTFAIMTWSGDVPPQKWMNFYTKVLSKFASGKGLKLKLNFEITPEGGVSKQKLEETKAALRELGLSDNLDSI